MSAGEFVKVRLEEHHWRGQLNQPFCGWSRVTHFFRVDLLDENGVSEPRHSCFCGAEGLRVEVVPYTSPLARLTKVIDKFLVGIGGNEDLLL